MDAVKRTTTFLHSTTSTMVWPSICLSRRRLQKRTLPPLPPGGVPVCNLAPSREGFLHRGPFDVLLFDRRLGRCSAGGRGRLAIRCPTGRYRLRTRDARSDHAVPLAHSSGGGAHFQRPLCSFAPAERAPFFLSHVLGFDGQDAQHMPFAGPAAPGEGENEFDLAWISLLTRRNADRPTERARSIPGGTARSGLRSYDRPSERSASGILRSSTSAWITRFVSSIVAI